MLVPLLLMAFAFKFYYLWVMLVRIRQELMAQRIRALKHMQAIE
jgi:heme exporter protein C